jgi:Mn2+/Fe2+ NRAMP family transporter
MKNELFINNNRRFISSLWKKVLLFLSVFGPATITAMADNDAGGIATYSSPVQSWVIRFYSCCP